MGGMGGGGTQQDKVRQQRQVGRWGVSEPQDTPPPQNIVSILHELDPTVGGGGVRLRGVAQVLWAVREFLQLVQKRSSAISHQEGQERAGGEGGIQRRRSAVPGFSRKH